MVGAQMASIRYFVTDVQQAVDFYTTSFDFKLQQHSGRTWRSYVTAT